MKWNKMSILIPPLPSLNDSQFHKSKRGTRAQILSVTKHKNKMVE